MTDREIRVAVVGASVRGTSLVDRLLAAAPAIAAGRPVTVTVYDPHPPGSGRIWRDMQPHELIMNTVAAQSTVFADESVRIPEPLRPGPSLAEWCRMVTADPTLADLPPHVAAEASVTVDWSSPSRLLYGHYLRWCFARISASAPEGVRVRVVAARVTSLTRRGARWAISTEPAAPPSDSDGAVADAVILAVGWLGRGDLVTQPGAVAPGNPIDQDLAVVRPGERVAVEGLGMGFFDVMSMLTEGRGGRFADDGAGGLVYHPSGRESHLIAGSRRGVPYRAKPAFGAPPFFPAQRVLRAALPELIARRPVDFDTDVLPLIERDARHDYYATLGRVRPQAVRDLASLLDALVNAGPDVDADALIDAHVADPADRLSLADAADPFRAAGVRAPGASADALVAELVRRDALEARRGADSPLKMALHWYAAARGALIDLVSFGGLTARSFPAYRRFLAVAASFGSGPPLLRAEQLVALHDAGIVRFTGPGLRVTSPGGADGLVAEADSGVPEPVDRVIHAWLPAPTVTHTSDPLLRDLVAGGHARAWRHDDGSVSDALDVRADDGAVLAADGTPSPGLYSVGVPHEDTRVFTIIAPVPGTNSSVLRETDAAARAALRHAASFEHHPS